MPEFRSMASILLPPKAVEPALVEAPALEAAVELPEEVAGEGLRAAALFYAHLREELLCSVDALTAGIARDVLARELHLGAADLAGIVERAAAQYAALEPLRVRVSPGQAVELASSLPVVADESLQPGDAILELRSGSVDLRLETRFDDVVRAVQR